MVRPLVTMRERRNAPRRERYAATSLLLVGALALLMLPLAGLFLLAAAGGVGDCFEAPCGPPPIPALFLLVALLALVLPVIALRALFGDHRVARVLLLVSTVPVVVGSPLAGGFATYVGAVAAVVILSASLLAWWKAWRAFEPAP